MQVFKFVLEKQDSVVISMPVRAKVLSAQFLKASGELCVWALVNPTHAWVNRRFYVHSTGQTVMNEGAEFIGTAQMYDQQFHVFVDPEDGAQF